MPANPNVENTITANSSQLGQVINDNFVQTPEEQAQSEAQEQLEEISLDELVPKPNTVGAVGAVGANDIVNPEDNLTKFNEEAEELDLANSGQSGSESGSQMGSEPGSQMGSNQGSQMGSDQGSQSGGLSGAKVIKLG